MTASRAAQRSPAAEAPALVLGARMLHVRFCEPQRVLSWAVAGGGLRRARDVVWLEVDDDELRPPVDARRYARERLRRAGAPGAVTLMTSRRLDAYVDARVVHDSTLHARCIATVGLGNALRAGDPPGPHGRIGTINLLCALPVPLCAEAMLEALALAAEARALAMLEANVASRRSGLPATGTGTDCIAVSCPVARGAGEHGRALRYAGKHTAVGHVIGAAVESAVRRGVEQWLLERAAPEGRS